MKLKATNLLIFLQGCIMNQYNVRIIENENGDVEIGFVHNLSKPRKTKDGMVMTWTKSNKKIFAKILKKLKKQDCIIIGEKEFKL